MAERHSFSGATLQQFKMKSMKSQFNSATSGTGSRGLLIVLFCLTLAFCMATKIGPQAEARLVANGAGDDDPVARWLGTSRVMFANSFFVKADAYFHSG